MHTIDGICCHIPNSSDCNRIKRCNFKWARVDINWYDIESSMGHYNWSNVDKAISTCKSSNLSVYASIAYTPSWMSSRLSDPPISIEYYRFCHDVASRYKDSISVYSIWNEPNLPTYFTGTLKDYVNQCLTPGSTAIKQVNPNYLVAAPDLAINGSNWVDWLDGLKKSSSHFDIISFHNYCDTPAELIRRYNDGANGKIAQIFCKKYRPYKKYLSKFKKPIWMTEIGWNTIEYDQKEQATRIIDLSNHRRRMNVDKIFLYVLRDSPADAEKPFGIYTYDGRMKYVVNCLT